MAKGKDLKIIINADEIVGSEVVRSGDYRYASMGVKRGNDEYMRISYEWKGDSIPNLL